MYIRKRSAAAGRASVSRRVAIVERMDAFVVCQNVVVNLVRTIKVMRKVISQQEEAVQPQQLPVQVSMVR